MSTLSMTMGKLHTYLPQATIFASQDAQNRPIQQVSTDSRKLGHGDFFVALHGEKFDGHDFLPQVQARGALGCLISNQSKAPQGFPTLLVEDTKEALGKMAHAWRKELGTKLAVVTGSNGKTTVKEMIASIFTQAVGQAKTLSTQGNLNNEIGLPLTILRLRAEHALAVIELGMNHPGETHYLADIAGPDITLINNAQREHQEFMQTVEAVAQEHALAINALPAHGIAIFPGESPYANTWYEAAGTRQCITFAFADIKPHDIDETLLRPVDIQGIWNDQGQLEIKTHYWASKAVVNLRTLGNHNARNALAASAVSIAAGITKDDIVRGLESFEAVNGRMKKWQIHVGSMPITIIDDTYNANPDSVIAAINAMTGLVGQHWLVLGDMGEVGDQGPAFHQEIGRYAANNAVHQLHSIGTLTQFSQQSYQQSTPQTNHAQLSQHHETMENLLACLVARIQLFVHEKTSTHIPTPLVILVKGSRFTKMERVVQHLLAKEIPCY